MAKRKVLTRLETARAIVEAHDDLTVRQFRNLPKAERQLLLDSLEYLEYQRYVEHRRKLRKKRIADKIAKETAREKRRRARKISKKRRRAKVVETIEDEIDYDAEDDEREREQEREYSLTDDYPELDVLDNLEDMLAEVLEAESDRYNK